jgi:hypothetical protein
LHRFIPHAVVEQRPGLQPPRHPQTTAPPPPRPPHPRPQVFSNGRADYHITVFHLSYFQDTRPDSLSPGGGCDLNLPVTQRPAATAAQLAAEVAALRRAFVAEVPFELQVGRRLRINLWQLHGRAALDL